MERRKEIQPRCTQLWLWTPFCFFCCRDFLAQAIVLHDLGDDLFANCLDLQFPLPARNSGLSGTYRGESAKARQQVLSLRCSAIFSRNALWIADDLARELPRTILPCCYFRYRLRFIA